MIIYFGFPSNKAPQPAEKWDGEFHAVKDGPICTQRDPFRRDHEIEGSEDCLQLNVYAPYSVHRDCFFSLIFLAIIIKHDSITIKNQQFLLRIFAFSTRKRKRICR